jgi:hypothetical protein
MLPLPSTILWRFSQMFISWRMMKTNKGLWFCFAGRTMRGTEFYELQRMCVRPAKFYFLRDSAQKELQHFPATQQSLQFSLHILYPSPLLSFQIFHKYTPVTTLSLHLHTQFYLFHLHSTFSQHSIHVVHCNTLTSFYWIVCNNALLWSVCCFMLLLKFEVCFSHNLVENKIWPDPRHVLCNAKPSMSILVFSPTCGQTKQN